MRRRRPKPEHPPGVLATPDQLSAWDQMTRNFRTCWYCGNIYTSATDTTRCELAHEAERGDTTGCG